MEGMTATLLPPAEVTFEADTHTYRNSKGVAYLSVTTLLKSAFPFDEQRIALECSQNQNSRYFGQKPADIIKFWNGIAETGSGLHKAVEAWSRTGIVPAESELYHDAVNFFASGKWKGELHPEQIVWCHEHQLAGTIDIIEDCGDSLRLWDIKTSRRIDGEKHEKYSIQLFIYAKLLSALLNRPVTPRGIIWFEDFKHKPTQKPKVLPLLPLQARADALMAKRKQDLKLTVATLAPDVAKLLRDYQRMPAARLIAGFDAHTFLLDGSDLGSGKSYTAMAVCRARGLRPVIICRKAAFSAWKKVAAYFGFTDPVISNYEYVRTGNSPLGKWVKRLVGKPGHTKMIEVFEWQLPGNSLLVLDECHWCSGLRTQNADLLFAAAYQKLPVLGLSATAADSPLKMRALGYALGLHYSRNFDQWLSEHGCEKGKWGYEFSCGIPRNKLVKWSGKDKDGADIWKAQPEMQVELDKRRLEVMGRIHQAIYKSGRGVRIRINEVPGFPEIEIVPYAMDFDTHDKIAKAYADLRDELEMLKRHQDRLAARQTAHKKIEMLKCEAIAEEVNELVREGYSVPVFTNFTDSLHKMADLCKTDCRVWGGQTDADRVRSLEQFQDNSKHVIILNNQAGGESIGLHDLLGQRQRISYIFPTFWSVAFKQVTGRTRRDGALSKSIMRIPFAAGTIEELAYDSCIRKCAHIDALNDGDLAMGLTI